MGPDVDKFVYTKLRVFFCFSGVDFPFEFDWNPSKDRQQISWISYCTLEDRQQIHHRLRKTANEFFGGLPKGAENNSFYQRPLEDRLQIHHRLRKTANEFIGGLPKGLNQIRRHY